jgi:hypothetical protein
MKAKIQGNDIVGIRGKALALNPVPSSNSGSTFEVTVDQNSIGNNTADSGSQESNAIDITAAGAATTKISVTNNAIKHWQLNALRIDSAEKEVVSPIGSGNNQVASSDFIISNNVISNPDAGSLDTMQLNVGLQSGAAAQNVCANIGGLGSNAFGGTHGAGAGDFDLQISERFNGNLRFPGFAGDGGDQTAVQTFIRNQNTGSPTVALIDNAISGGAACSAPTDPPGVTP